ncbi:class I SAM-dependent methyltransferase [Clostridium drakei]|nr:class I SAM-dependent methyltransferase [Clostridium drakei]
MTKSKINLSGVNETMLVPVYARALESKKKKPAFYDETAINIINSLDYDFKKHGKSKLNMWGCSARTIILDREVSSYIKKHPNCSVINMACGLDARFNRVDNGKIQWYNIDFENVMNIRKTIFPKNDRVTNVSSSILENSWIEKVKNKDNVLVIAEGLLMYLEENEVKRLFETVSVSFKHCAVLCELMSKWMVKNQKIHDTIKKTTAVFRWGVDTTDDFIKLCPMYKILGDFNLTDTMKRFSPIFLSLIAPKLRPKNNRIGYFEKLS